MIRGVVAAEIAFYRDGLAWVLPRYGITVAGVASTPTETLAHVSNLIPHVTLLDMSMGRSIDVLRELTLTLPDVKVLALAVHEREHDVLACVEAGAVGYVARDQSLEDLVDSIKRSIRDEPLASPRIVATLMRRVSRIALTEVDPRAASLTMREGQILSLIERGLSNKEIGTRLCIEVATVKNHVHNILEKLNVSNRVKLRRGCEMCDSRRNPQSSPERVLADLRC